MFGRVCVLHVWSVCQKVYVGCVCVSVCVCWVCEVCVGGLCYLCGVCVWQSVCWVCVGCVECVCGNVCCEFVSCVCGV